MKKRFKQNWTDVIKKDMIVVKFAEDLVLNQLNGRKYHLSSHKSLV